MSKVNLQLAYELDALVMLEDTSRGPCKHCGFNWSAHIVQKLGMGSAENLSCQMFEVKTEPTLH